MAPLRKYGMSVDARSINPYE